ncbi:hypothetical protein ACTWQF_05905 [Streptomyces sp. 8N114]|uniref:hypothetical protein n=1 Tax=Streptomyces sp. 8N114 TaxID=3457419 RepID=UPI003FD438B7
MPAWAAVFYDAVLPALLGATRTRAPHRGRTRAGSAARPEWGPTLRTAHVRDPEGNVLEFQSY